MNESTNNWPGPSPRRSTNEVLAAIRADVENELAHLEASADLPNDDEPAREYFETRIRSLRDATAALEQAPEER
ncbi:hypothetical protein [Nocardioides sp. YIM 152315]|uniref:hypothetical protein n=1 Tax=Nocardioides sp. YIM 152315 TaxID=3031760 RepID=UPI0023DC2FE4|nr:hypothetical protein [Nocardioides sp. YIM 152315]MDF1605461.1 hypothetical protein [Nocardioides sp. YIM 152315]